MHDALLFRLPANSPLALGFSGGGDSLYLLQELREWFPDRTCHALIVDHGIRVGSAQDAIIAAEMAKDLGAVPTILTWNGPALRGHAAARRARYVLLAREMRKIGVQHLLLAHTQDDQLETFFLRAQGRSHWRGLRGMGMAAAYPVWPEGHGLQILRPLLDVSRAVIRSGMKAQNGRWLEDPANADRRFARVRVRQALLQMEAGGLQRDHVLRTMAHLRKLFDQEAALVQSLINQHVCFDPFGFAQLSPDLATLPDHLLGQLLLRVTLAVSGAEILPHSGAHLCALFRKVAKGARLSRNQCLWFARENRVWITRDPGGVCGRAQVAAAQIQFETAGGSRCFDGRWRVRAPGPGRVMALCGRWHELSATDKDCLRHLPEVVRRTIPVWEDGTGLHLLAGIRSADCVFLGNSRGMETGKGFA